MTKKFLFAIVAIVVAMTLCVGTNVKAATEYEEPSAPTYVENGAGIASGKPFLFANGTPITISASEVPGESTVTYGENQTIQIKDNTIVFGGGHDTEKPYKTSSITMTGGKVKDIYGGGLHKSHVETANIKISGDSTVDYVEGGGASSLAGTTCHQPWYSGDTANATTRVDSANIEIAGGTITNLIGGGEGIGYTGETKVTVSEGTITNVVAGGTNGYTGKAAVEVTGGTITTMQSVNRGTMDSAEMTVTGGTVSNLYVGGDESADTTGTITSVDVQVKGEAKVDTLKVGKNGNSVMSADTENITVTFDNGTVTNVEKDSFLSIAEMLTIKINGNEYKIEKGKSLSSLDLAAEKTKAGYNFVNFVVAGTEEVFAEDKAIDSAVELTSVFTAIPSTDEPDTDTPADDPNTDNSADEQETEDPNTNTPDAEEEEPVAEEEAEEEAPEEETEEEEVSNPKTADNVMVSVAIGLVGVATVAGVTVYRKRK